MRIIAKVVHLTMLALGLTVMLIQTPSAGAFGEVAVSAGGIYPQGSFAHYADPGFSGTARATVHIPNVEMFAGWIDFSFASFSNETIKTSRTLAELDNGVVLKREVDQTTSESMFAAHIGLQLASPTRRAFFRPRAALGIGIYGFRNTITWTEQDGDSTVTLADETLDSQTSPGWRALLGVDFFITTQWGATADFIYDHVFDLNQVDGPSADADRTSRFQGFSVGVIYMFAVE